MAKKQLEENNPIARKFLIGLGILLLLLAALTFGFKKFIDYTGAREWEKTRAMLIREGVEFDLENLLPEVPPDEENFSATPMIAALAWNYPEDEQKRILIEKFREMRILRRAPAAPRGWKSGYPDFRSQRGTDFTVIAHALVEAGDIPSDDSNPPVPAIQKWIEQFRPEIDALDEASLRPHAVWPEPPLFNYTYYHEERHRYIEDLIVHQKFQAVRAATALAAKDEDEAISALRIMFQISRTLSSQPFLIPQLAAQNTQSLILSIIWEGIENQKWSAKGLTQIQDFLSRYPVDAMERLEKAANVALIAEGIGLPDYIATLPFRERLRNAREVQHMDGSNPLPYRAALALSPRGFLDHNRSFGCFFLYETAIRPARLRDPHSVRIDPDAAQMETSIQNYFPSLYLIPSQGTYKRFFEAVTILDMAKVAVAAERFQKSEERYPENLKELVPRYLPEVPLDLQSKEKRKTLSYRIENDRPLIYSAGQNQTDEGGKIVWREHSPEKKYDRKQGDWVWGYTQPSPEKSDNP